MLDWKKAVEVIIKLQDKDDGNRYYGRRVEFQSLETKTPPHEFVERLLSHQYRAIKNAGLSFARPLEEHEYLEVDFKK
jgi:hypothetical protein